MIFCVNILKDDCDWLPSCKKRRKSWKIKKNLLSRPGFSSSFCFQGDIQFKINGGRDIEGICYVMMMMTFDQVAQSDGEDSYPPHHRLISSTPSACAIRYNAGSARTARCRRWKLVPKFSTQAETCQLWNHLLVAILFRLQFFLHVPEGVSPWALLRLAGGGNVSNFEKLTFFFFFGFWLPWVPKKSSKKNFFEIRKFQCFTVSLFHCFSVSVFLFQSIFVIRLSPNLSRFSTKDRGKKSFVGTETLFLEIGVDPLRCPPCPLAPKNVFFSPNFQLQISQKIVHFSKQYREIKSFPDASKLISTMWVNLLRRSQGAVERAERGALTFLPRRSYLRKYQR